MIEICVIKELKNNFDIGNGISVTVQVTGDSSNTNKLLLSTMSFFAKIDNSF